MTPKNGTTELPSQPASCVAESEGPTCYICFEAGPDESGRPLTRDCSCRGNSAGFAHLSCIVRFAEGRSENYHNDGNMNKFSDPWKCCIYCHQDYQNELAADLGGQFTRFVERKYPSDRACKLEALVLELSILHYKKEKNKEAEEISKQILSIIEEMKAEAPTLSPMIQLIEADTYRMLGRMLFFGRNKREPQGCTDQSGEMPRYL